MQEEITKKQKKSSTNFYIRIYYQQNCSWQGEIQWLDSKNGGKLFFRSFLEMILLLQGAIDKNNKLSGRRSLRNWEKSEKTDQDIEDRP